MFQMDEGLRSTLLGKRAAAFGNNRGTYFGSIDKKLSASNHANSILNSCVSFIPAKRPYDAESKGLKMKYIRLRASSTSPVKQKVNGKFSSSQPSTSNLFDEFHTVVSAKKKPDGSYSSSEASIPTPMFEIFPADAVRIVWSPKLKRSTAIGLHNLGNTCFLNSVLQILTNTAPLTNHLMSDEHDIRKCPSSTGFCALCRMKMHLQTVFSRSAGGAFEPRAIVNCLKMIMKSHGYGRQEDAHEFLRYFIDAMQTAALHAYKPKQMDLFTKETSVIGRIFGGYHKNDVICNKCQYNSTTFDPFLDLSVEVKHSQSLNQALAHFTRPETLSHDNAYKCPRCKMRVSARKMFTIHQAPNVLTIQFKRFDHTGKIDRFISYPEKLDLRPYMTEKQGPPVNYKLYGVIIHQGRSTRCGHYYAYVRNPCDQWHVLDDSRAAPIAEIRALKASGAYVLFYIRIPTPMIVVKPNGLSSIPNSQHTDIGRAVKTDGDRRDRQFPVSNGVHKEKLLSPKRETPILNGVQSEKKLAPPSRQERLQFFTPQPKKPPPKPTVISDEIVVRPLIPKPKPPTMESELQGLKKKRKREKEEKRERKAKKKMKRARVIIEEEEDETNGSTAIEDEEIQTNGHGMNGFDQDTADSVADEASIAVETNGSMDGEERRQKKKRKRDKEKKEKMREKKEKKQKKKLKRARRMETTTEDDGDANGTTTNGFEEEEFEQQVRSTNGKPTANGHAKNIVEQLMKRAGSGYGKSVRSWADTSNLVDAQPNEEETPEENGVDDGGWNQEYDRGKVKKRKKKRGQLMTMGANVFQSVQNTKNRMEQKKLTHYFSPLFQKG